MLVWIVWLWFVNFLIYYYPNMRLFRVGWIYLVTSLNFSCLPYRRFAACVCVAQEWLCYCTRYMLQSVNLNLGSCGLKWGNNINILDVTLHSHIINRYSRCFTAPSVDYDSPKLNMMEWNCYVIVCHFEVVMRIIGSW